MKIKLLVLGLLILFVFLLIPGAALGWTPYSYGPPWATPYVGSRGAPATPTVRQLRLTRSADQNNYYVNVHVTGITPQEVTVAVEGDRWLAVRTEDSREFTYENTAPDRGAYTRSFSYSSGSASRRFSLPRDANMAAMQREDGEGQVRIVIPRFR